MIFIHLRLSVQEPNCCSRMNLGCNFCYAVWSKRDFQQEKIVVGNCAACWTVRTQWLALKSWQRTHRTLFNNPPPTLAYPYHFLVSQPTSTRGLHAACWCCSTPTSDAPVLEFSAESYLQAGYSKDVLYEQHGLIVLSVNPPEETTLFHCDHFVPHTCHKYQGKPLVGTCAGILYAAKVMEWV